MGRTAAVRGGLGKIKTEMRARKGGERGCGPGYQGN